MTPSLETSICHRHGPKKEKSLTGMGDREERGWRQQVGTTCPGPSATRGAETASWLESTGGFSSGIHAGVLIGRVWESRASRRTESTRERSSPRQEGEGQSSEGEADARRAGREPEGTDSCPRAWGLLWALRPFPPWLSAGQPALGLPGRSQALLWGGDGLTETQASSQPSPSVSVSSVSCEFPSFLFFFFLSAF